MPGPKVLSTLLQPSAPSVGQTVTLKVRAQDAGFAMDGLAVNTGDSGKTLGASSCELTKVNPAFTPGRVATYTLTFTFTTPGTHHLTYSVLSGGCSHARVTTGSIDVIVSAAAGAASLHRHALPAAKKTCANANLVIGPTTLNPTAKAILCLLNIQRAKKHLKPMKNNFRLAQSALFQANDMVRRRFFAHIAPDGRPGVVQRFRAAGYRSPTLGENIAYADTATPQAMVTAWMESPPHKANILYKGFRFVGVGIVLEKPTGAPTPGETFVTDFGAGPK